MYIYILILIHFNACYSTDHYMKPFCLYRMLFFYHLSFKLFFTEVPQISKPSVQASYKEGSSVNISCTALGTPDPNVRWFRNGTVKGSGKKTAFLVFSSINRGDNGQYTCRANNTAGNDEEHVTLVVHCK